MAKYLKHDSQIEYLVEEKLPLELSEPEPVSVSITDSKNVHVGVETIHNENVILQEVYPKSCDSKIDLLNVKNLVVNSQDQLEKITTNLGSFNSKQNGEYIMTEHCMLIIKKTLTFFNVRKFMIAYINSKLILSSNSKWIRASLMKCTINY